MLVIRDLAIVIPLLGCGARSVDVSPHVCDEVAETQPSNWGLRPDVLAALPDEAGSSGNVHVSYHRAVMCHFEGSVEPVERAVAELIAPRHPSCSDNRGAAIHVTNVSRYETAREMQFTPALSCRVRRDESLWLPATTSHCEIYFDIRAVAGSYDLRTSNSKEKGCVYRLVRGSEIHWYILIEAPLRFRKRCTTACD
jgi:hypothetical protein